MKKFVFPVIMAMSLGVGFVGCGGGGSDAEEQLAEERAKLDQQQARIDRIKELQLKQKDSELTPEEQKELDDLYAQLESEGSQG